LAGDLSDCFVVNGIRVRVPPGHAAFVRAEPLRLSTFGNSACRQNFKVRYYRVTRLLTDLAIARGDGSYNKLMREL